MSCVIDLSKRRRAPRSLSHPAGVILPLEETRDADILIPEVRDAIERGTYGAELFRRLPATVCAGDRVLVVGSGLGVISSLIAQTPGVERVIAIEPDIALASYIDRVHELNGVPWIETLNAVPADGGRGRVPLFVRHDVRASSLVPEDGPWTKVMLVPRVSLDLVLAEEQISLIVLA